MDPMIVAPNQLEIDLSLFSLVVNTFIFDPIPRKSVSSNSFCNRSGVVANDEPPPMS